MREIGLLCVMLGWRSRHGWVVFGWSLRILNDNFLVRGLITVLRETSAQNEILARLGISYGIGT